MPAFYKMSKIWTTSILPDDAGTTWIVKAQSVLDSSLSFQFNAQMVHGVAYPPWCNQTRWDSLNDRICYRDTDLLIATYPKCGTTWVEQCVLLLLGQGTPENLNPASKNTYIPDLRKIGKIWPEASIEQSPLVQEKTGAEFSPITFDQFDKAPTPRVIKSHSPPQLLLGTYQQGLSRLPSHMKVIVVTRNPLDACVSSYYHAFNPFKSGWPFSAWASVWLNGLSPHGSWFSWAKGWNQERISHPDRVHWIQYEDLQRDPIRVVRDLALFLGDLVFEKKEDESEFESNSRFDSLLERVVAGSSFECMREQAPSSTHLRKGVSGDWENHFDEELKTDFEETYRSEMRGSGLVFSLGKEDQFLR